MLAVAKCVVFAHEIQPKTVTVSHSDLRSLDSAIFPASTREASVESYIFPTQQQTVRKLRLRSNGKSNSLQLRRRRGPNHCHPPYTRPHISTARRLLLPFSARHALRSIHFDLPLSRCHVSCKSLPTRRTTPLPKCPALPCTASVRTAITIFCNGFLRETVGAFGHHPYMWALTRSPRRNGGLQASPTCGHPQTEPPPTCARAPAAPNVMGDLQPLPQAGSRSPNQPPHPRGRTHST